MDFAGLAVGQIMQGTLSDRLGRRRPLMLGFGVYSRAGHDGAALAPNLEVLAVLRFVGAIGASAGMVISRAIVRRSRQGTRVRYPDVTTYAGDGRRPNSGTKPGRRVPDIRELAVHLLVPGAVWRVMCGAGVAHIAGDIAGSAPDQGRARANRVALSLDPARTSVPRARVHGLRVDAFLHMFAYLGGSSPVFIQGFGLSPSAFGAIFGLCSCGLIAGSQINARLLPRFGLFFMLRFICRVSLTATGVLLVLSFSGVHVLWMIVVPIFVALSCQGFNNGNTAAGALMRHAGHAGSAAALLGVAQFALGATSGLLVGLLTDGTPRGMALLMFGGALFAAIADLFRQRM